MAIDEKLDYASVLKEGFTEFARFSVPVYGQVRAHRFTKELNTPPAFEGKPLSHFWMQAYALVVQTCVWVPIAQKVSEYF